MRHLKTGQYWSFFRVMEKTRRSQAAMMVLKSGQSTGDEDNEHPMSDQWLYVISGRGQAVVEGRKVSLRKGSLLLIEARETHEIKNTGRRQLVTLNVYAPPTY